MQLKFIGCGDAFGSGGRFNTCMHVRGRQVNFLIDCGASSLVALKSQRVSLNEIQAIFITHFHADHFGGVPFLMLDAQFFSRRKERLDIAGPVGLRQWYLRVMETSFPGSSQTQPKFPLHLHELVVGGTETIAGVQVSSFQARHGPLGGPFHCLRLQAEGRTIAYTGDTEWTQELLSLGRNADLLVAEAYFVDKKIPLHLDVATLASRLDVIGAKRVMLTHMSDDVLERQSSLPYEFACDGLTVDI